MTHMGLVMRKPVFGVSNKASLKPFYSATETCQKIENSPVLSLHMILSEKRITKALISLRGSAGWSAPLLFANPKTGFRVAAHIIGLSSPPRKFLDSILYLLLMDMLALSTEDTDEKF